MKKNLFFTVASVFLILGLLSFTLTTKKPPVTKPHNKKELAVKTSKLKQACVADICTDAYCTGNPISVQFGGGSITINWVNTGNPAYFSYGGYGVVTTGTTADHSRTYSVTSATSRFGVQCVCTDGTRVGSTHGVMFSSAGYSIF